MAPRKNEDLIAELKNHMDSRFSEIKQDLRSLDEKQDRLNERQAEQNSTLVAQHRSLDEHVKRTNLLEEKLERVENRLEDKIEDVEGFVTESLEPIKKQVATVNIVFKVLKIAAKIAIPVLGLFGLGAGVLELIKAFF